MAQLISKRARWPLAALALSLAVSAGAPAVFAQAAQTGNGFGAGGVGFPGFGLGGATGTSGYVDLDAGLAYTDNAALTATDPRSDELLMAGFDTDYLRQGSALDVTALGAIAWVQYLQHTYPGTPFGHFVGTAIWGQPTNPLQWTLSETFGEGMADPLLAPTPDNFEYINYVTTGPTLNLNFTGSDRVTLRALYSDVTYQDSPFDSEMYNGGASFTHALSVNSSLALQANLIKTHYTDQAAAPDYDTRLATLVYTAALERTNLTATVGYTQVNYEGPQSGSPLYILELRRILSPDSSVFVRAQSGLTAPSDALTANLDTPVGAAALNAQTPEAASTAPFTERFASAGWDFHLARTALSIYGIYTDARYEQEVAPVSSGATEDALAEATASAEDAAFVENENLGAVMARFVRPVSLQLGSATSASALDDIYKSLSAVVSRTLRPTWTLSVTGTRTWSQYEYLGGSAVNTYVRLSLVKQFGKAGLSVFAERQDNSGSGAATTDSYHEDRIGVEFTYDLVGQRPGGPATAFPGF